MPSVQQLQKALEIYRSIYGNCRIPEDYVIRSNASKFPRELRGSLFGQLIRDIRQGKRYCGLLQRRIWRSFGLYDEDEEGHSMEEKFVIIFKALKIFRKEHGHLQVSRNFVIPNNDELFPPDSWGLPLGMILSNIRNLGSWCTTRNHVTKLASIDAIACYYDQDIFRLMPSGNDVYNALQTFFQLHGHLDIPLDYVVPSSDNGTNSSYEEVMHGCALGRVLQDIKLGKQYIATQFKALWKSCNISITSSFVANLTENVQQQELRERFDALVTAIEIYKDIYGNISVVQSYVTPSSDEISLQNDTVIANPFPLQCRNFSLGDYVYKIRGVGRWMRLEFVFRLKDLGVINFYFVSDFLRTNSNYKLCSYY